jgi:hypothetical protein
MIQSHPPLDVNYRAITQLFAGEEQSSPSSNSSLFYDFLLATGKFNSVVDLDHLLSRMIYHCLRRYLDRVRN